MASCYVSIIMYCVWWNTVKNIDKVTTLICRKALSSLYIVVLICNVTQEPNLAQVMVYMSGTMSRRMRC